MRWHISIFSMRTNSSKVHTGDRGGQVAFAGQSGPDQPRSKAGCGGVPVTRRVTGATARGESHIPARRLDEAGLPNRGAVDAVHVPVPTDLIGADRHDNCTETRWRRLDA